MRMFQNPMNARWRAWACAGPALLLALLLAACGGGSAPDDDGPQATAAPAAVSFEPPIAVFPGRGEPRSQRELATIPLASITQAVAAAGSRYGGTTPRYSVRTLRLSYLTLDGQGRLVEASGLLALPLKAAGRTSPVLSYQHGTIVLDAEAPSNAIAADQAPIVLASLGYIVAAPDYVGYGVSKGQPHPYLLSAPSAAAVVDLLTAARLWRQTFGAPGNGQLFLVGYSEGGYATMAAHRELQATGSVHLDTLVAAVPGGGPYDVGTTLDRLLARIKDENILLGALINPGFLRHLGSTIRDEVRRAIVRKLIPDEADVVFQFTFLDNFLADDVGAMERMSNVHDWKPLAPVRMYHGRDDQTVPYPAASKTLEAMMARGADPRIVSLTDCEARPSGHLECVPPYFTRMVAYLATLARDL